MAATVFVNGVTLTDDEWFNDVDNAIYDQIVNVKNSAYGAVGDGSTDDSAAILAAVNAAAALTAGAYSSRAAVYFPPGIYKLASSAALTETNATSVAAGIHFYGAGMFTSILRLAPSGSDLYFYNNVATAREQFCTFADLGFEGIAPASLSAYTDISNNAKGFRQYSVAHEQGFKFTRCRFFGLHTMFETAGTNTASENSFVQCKITHIKSVVLSIDNPQSFNHEFHETDIEVIYGDVFKVGATGGGAIKMYGGSVIMMSDTAADTYFFKATASSGLGATPIIFSGVRYEFRGNTTNLVSVPALQQFNIGFENCQLQDQATVTKAAWVTIGNHSTVYFRQCIFNDAVGANTRFVVAANGAGMFGINGEIIFDKCQLKIDWSDRCSVTGAYGGGLISARDCFGTNIAASGDTVNWTHDFDLHWSDTAAGQVGSWLSSGAVRDSGSPSHPQWRLKTAQMKMTSNSWPSTGGQTLKLPKNAIIKAIHIRKPAGSADVTVTTVNVSRNDKTGTPHLTSNNAAWNTTHTGDVDNYFYYVGSTVNERTLILYSGAVVTGNIQGGFCIVEYY